MKAKKIAGVALLVLLIAAMAFTFDTFREKSVEGEKSITIEVVMQDESSTVYEVDTDEEYLLGAMEEADGLTFEGEEGPYGMSISTINGVRADYNEDGAYWAIMQGDDYLMTGVDTTPIANGDSYAFVYTEA